MDMFTHSLTASSQSPHHPHHHRVTKYAHRTGLILRPFTWYFCVSWKILCLWHVRCHLWPPISDKIKLDQHLHCKSCYILSISSVLKPYYGCCWNCSSLVLYISDSNQGVFSIIISQYYSKITNLTIRKTLITRKDVTRKEKVDICWVYSAWAEITYSMS